MRIARKLGKLAAAALAVAALSVTAQAGQPAELKRDVYASGPALTLADLFVDAGPEGARAVAPAPRLGETSRVSARFISAAAAAAGLSWAPPDGLDQITVTRRAVNLGPATRRQFAALTTPAVRSDAAPPVMVRRGDTITLVYVAPGLQLTTRGKALADAGLGDSVRIVNMQSNRIVDATVTGPGAASANSGAF